MTAKKSANKTEAQPAQQNASISQQELQALIIDRNRLNFLDTCLAHVAIGKKIQPGFMINFNGTLKNINYSVKSKLNIRGAIDTAMREHLTEISAPFMSEKELEAAIAAIDKSLNATVDDTKILQDRKIKFEEQLKAKKATAKKNPKAAAKPRAASKAATTARRKTRR